MKSPIIGLLMVIFLISGANAQDSICLNYTLQHEIKSEALQETRNYWVSLPLHYSDSLEYPVIYVLDAEWRFDLVRHIAFDLGGNDKINRSIIVGIPHIDWEKKRGIDLTFSASGVEYDGEKVGPRRYNSTNSGEAQKFYNYLVNELVPHVNNHYPVNGHETLVGHSYGGYFGGYLLSLKHPFEVLHIYDPSIWFSNGEVIERVRNHFNKQAVTVFLTYQPEPTFHKEKIELFIAELEQNERILLSKHLYENETHNSLYLDSFYSGISATSKTTVFPKN